MSQATEALFPEKHQLIIEKIELDYIASKLKSHFNTLSLYGGEEKASTGTGKFVQRQKRHMS